MKKRIYSFRKIGGKLAAVAIAAVSLGASQGAFADTWQATPPDQIKIIEGQNFYVLQKGDTLWAVSEAVGIDMEVLAKLSDIDLVSGQQYRLPVGYIIRWNDDKTEVQLVAPSGEVEASATFTPGGEVVVNQSFTVADTSIQSTKDVETVKTSQSQPTEVIKSTKETLQELSEVIESVSVTEDGISHVKLKDDVDVKEVAEKLEELKQSEVTQEVQETTEEVVEDEPETEVSELPTDETTDESTFETEIQPVEEEIVKRNDKITLLRSTSVSANFVLIESNGQYALFDAGTSGSQEDYDYVTGYLKELGVNELDFIMLSHLDPDHINTVTSVYGQEKRLLFDDFRIKQMYLKKPEDSRVYRIAPPLGVTGEEFYLHNMKIYEDILEKSKANDVEVIVVEDNFSMSFGDFDIDVINTASSDSREQGNYWNNLDSLVQLIRKKDDLGNEYNILLTHDLEGYDIPRVIEELKQLNVDSLDVMMLPHHGYSMNQTESADIVDSFGVPVTVATNSEEVIRKNSSDNYEKVMAVYSNGIYWQGEGSVQVDFTNLDNGVTVYQEGGNQISNIIRTDDVHSITHETMTDVVTREDMILEKNN